MSVEVQKPKLAVECPIEPSGLTKSVTIDDMKERGIRHAKFPFGCCLNVLRCLNS